MQPIELKKTVEIFEIEPNSFIMQSLLYGQILEIAQITTDTPTKMKKHLLLATLFFMLIFAHITTIWADETEENSQKSELKEQQQKLKNILDEIADTREQRAEQKVLLEKLNKKMECNWALIKDYDACDKEHKDKKSDQLSCIQKAKSKASECLSEIDGLNPQ